MPHHLHMLPKFHFVGRMVSGAHKATSLGHKLNPRWKPSTSWTSAAASALAQRGRSGRVAPLAAHDAGRAAVRQPRAVAQRQVRLPAAGTGAPVRCRARVYRAAHKAVHAFTS